LIIALKSPIILFCGSEEFAINKDCRGLRGNLRSFVNPQVPVSWQVKTGFEEESK